MTRVQDFNFNIRIRDLTWPNTAAPSFRQEVTLGTKCGGYRGGLVCSYVGHDDSEVHTGSTDGACGIVLISFSTGVFFGPEDGGARSCGTLESYNPQKATFTPTPQVRSQCPTAQHAHVTGS
jgi:hypothetical protein